MKTCFLFGHRDAPSAVLPEIQAAAERLYLEYDITNFMVGSRGAYDRIAATAIKALKRKYCISLQLLLAYHPAERPVQLSEGFDSSFYPLLDSTPRRFAITKANQYMVDHADAILCYVSHVGNTRSLLEYAQRRTHIPIINLATDL